MSTRKLIITALLCGMAILVAGGLKLFLTATDRVEVQVLSFGDGAELGDMEVQVLSAVPSVDATLVTVSMGGVDGADATAGWLVFTGTSVLEPIAPPEGVVSPCATTPADGRVQCVVAFPPSEKVQYVAYVRAGIQKRWAP